MFWKFEGKVQQGQIYISKKMIFDTMWKMFWISKCSRMEWLQFLFDKLARQRTNNKKQIEQAQTQYKVWRWKIILWYASHNHNHNFRTCIWNGLTRDQMLMMTRSMRCICSWWDNCLALLPMEASRLMMFLLLQPPIYIYCILLKTWSSGQTVQHPTMTMNITGCFFNWYPPKSSKYKKVNLG